MKASKCATKNRSKCVKSNGRTKIKISDIPLCAASMGCLCAGHARGNPASAPCDTTEIPPEPRFTEIRVTAAGFSGKEAVGIPGGPVDFSASWSLFLIREAWHRGCDFEAEADGYGSGAGTHGDWSGIRDSSPDAKRAMLEKALNRLFPRERS